MQRIVRFVQKLTSTASHNCPFLTLLNNNSNAFMYVKYFENVSYADPFFTGNFVLKSIVGMELSINKVVDSAIASIYCKILFVQSHVPMLNQKIDETMEDIL